MSKLRLLTILSIGLLLVNILLVGMMFSKKGGKSNHFKRPNPVEMFTKELNFTDAQKAKLEKLVKEHAAFMDIARKKSEPIKKELRQNIMVTNQEFNKDTLFTQLGIIQTEIESKFHEHFIQIRMLCEGDQIAKFEKLMEGLPNRGRPGGPPPRKR